MKVTLFPFLSVLLCMMGAMIMLLVVVAKNVREQAVSPASKTANQTKTLIDPEAEKQRQNIALRTEDADWLAENYRLAQKKAEEELTDTKNKLAVAEKETQKIRDELRRLEQLAQQLDSQASVSPAEVEQLKQHLSRQQRLKEQLELELAELQKEAAQKEKSYAIVPYQGQHGTYRRPIYIECCNNKIIIQPEGIELIPSDFLALDRPDNPFDSALRVIRQYYLETNQLVRGSEPYPLWIIRPSGVEMYEGARQATGSWVKEFGYEIVNEDWNIQYPVPNDELRDRIAQQLEISRSRLAGYLIAKRIAEQASESSSGSGRQYRVDRYGNVIPMGGMPTGGQAAGGPSREVIPTGGELPSGEDWQERLAAQRQPMESPAVNTQHVGQQAGREAGGETAAEEGIAEKTTAAASTKNISTGETNAGETSTEEPPPPPLQQTQPQRPKNWALKDATQFASGISRSVRIRCEANRFVLSAQAGLSAERPIPITDSVPAAADQLVQAVWEFQDSWGSAGANVYWRPRLQVQVLPGGEQRFAALKQHLKNSGLAVE